MLTRGVVLHGDRLATVDAIEIRPATTDALVKPKFVTLCRSDVHLWCGSMHDAQYPVVPGHEWVGVVEHAPPGWSALLGRTVVGDNLLPCRTCPQCRKGSTNLCERLEELGFTQPGACAEMLAIPPDNLYVLDREPSVELALHEPLAVAVHAIDRAGVTRGDTAVVIGCGAVGLLAAQVARARGALVVVADLRAERLPIATALGLRAYEVDAPDLADLGARCVVEASGSPSAFVRAIEIVAPGGTVCQLGYGALSTVAFAPSSIMLKELTIVGSLSSHDSWAEAVELVTRGAVELTTLVTNVFDLADFSIACDMLDHGDATRVGLVPNP